MTAGDLLDAALSGRPEAFALLHRPGATGPDVIEVLTGTVSLPATLADIPLSPAAPPARARTTRSSPSSPTGSSPSAVSPAPTTGHRWSR